MKTTLLRGESAVYSIIWNHLVELKTGGWIVYMRLARFKDICGKILRDRLKNMVGIREERQVLIARMTFCKIDLAVV